MANCYPTNGFCASVAACGEDHLAGAGVLSQEYLAHFSPAPPNHQTQVVSHHHGHEWIASRLEMGAAARMSRYCSEAEGRPEVRRLLRQIEMSKGKD